MASEVSIEQLSVNTIWTLAMDAVQAELGVCQVAWLFRNRRGQAK